MKKLLLGWMTVACALLALVAVSGSAAKPTKASQGTIRVAVVTDIGGLNDRSFNFLADQGRRRADRIQGVETRIFITQTAADRLPNIRSAAQQGYNLVFGVGFFHTESLNAVASAFPNTKFVGIDVNYADLKDKPTNVRGIQFAEEQAGYLVGYLAGLRVKRRPIGGQQKVGAVGAIQVPAIVRFIAGYRAGARRANPRVQVLVNYANDPTFADQAKCKEQALNQIANGASVIFQVAGGCGLGALDAAKERFNRGIMAIGVDADQAYLGRHVLTSALKRVDNAVVSTVRAFKANPTGFRTGYNVVFNARNGGVGVGRISPLVPRADRLALQRIQRQLAAGRIRVPKQ